MSRKIKIKTSLIVLLLIFTNSFGANPPLLDNEKIEIEVNSENKPKLTDKDPTKIIDETTGVNKVKGKETGQVATVTPAIIKKPKKVFGMSDNSDIKDYVKVSLVDVIFETISNNYNVKVAREKVRQAQINLNDAYSGYKPTLDLQYSNARIHTDPSDDGIDTPANEYNDESLKLQLKQNLYSGGATEYKIKGLKKSLQVAKNRYELAISTEIQNAIKAYIGVVFSYQSLNVTEANMKMLSRILEIVTTKYDLGAASIGDISSIKASVSNAESKLNKTNSKFVESLKYYEYIAGENFKYTLPYEYNFKIKIGDLEELLDIGYLQNLNIVSYLLTIESERYKLKSAQSAFKPKVDFELSRSRTFKKDAEPEDIYIQNTDSAMITFKYNLYNGGKDSNKILSVYSTIREVSYKIEEEKRKLKWIISNLHQSLNSIEGSIQSTIDEVESSQVTVESYWEAFKNGEQDLQTLLTAQRQLNTAQVSLIESYQSRLTDYFKLLFETGQLVSHFELDPTKDNFIDFTKSTYKKENSAKKEEQIDLIAFAKEQKRKEDAKNVKEVVQKVDTLEDILLFKDKFLDSEDDLYTIYIGKFDSIYETFNYVKENSFSKQSFIVDELENYKFKSILAYGLFEQKDEAKKVLDGIKKDENKEYKIVSIKDIKDLYKNYIDGYDELRPKELVETRTIKLAPKPPQEYFTNKEFKDKFVNADINYYTINLGTLSKLDDVVRLMDSEKLYDNSLIFRYGTNSEWIKVVYGVYENYEDAKVALALLSPNIVDKYFPIIENIKSKQELFAKYKDLKLGTPSFSTKKGEFIKISEETKTVLRDAKTKKEIKPLVKDKVQVEETTKKEENKVEEIAEKNIEVKALKETENKAEEKTIENVEEKTVEKAEEKVKDDLEDKIDKNIEIKAVEETQNKAEEKTIEKVEVKKVSKAEVEEKAIENIEEKVEEKPIEPLKSEKVIDTKIDEIKVKKPQELKTNGFILSIAKIEKNRLNTFINRYQLVDYKTRDLDDGYIEIYVGKYDDKKSALEKLSKYHPYIQSIAKIEKE